MSAADRARAAMVDALCTAGRVRSPAVEQALRAVPRHLFLPGASVAAAYADGAVAVQHVDGAATSSASQPSMVAIMLEQLDLRPGHRVLEIGAGTGWNAALMARIVGAAGHVTTVDIDADLVAGTLGHLAAADVSGVEVVCGDGALGHPAAAPYDRIVLTVGSDDVWPAWVAQLAPGGRLLLPLALRGSQLSMALDLAPDGTLHSHSQRTCGFIRLRGMGASARPAVALPGGVALHGPDDGPAPDRAAVAAALADPGPLVDSPVVVGPADTWDGFGLWLALTDPGALRLVAGGPDSGLPDPLGPAGAVACAAPAGEDSGIAVVVVRDGPAAVRAYGPGGPAQARRMLAALEAWAEVGAPAAPEWRFTIVSGPPPPAAPPSGVSTVRMAHCHLLARLP
ncbi:methyltransferase domain-containing protein [Pseudonocardia sp.]|uniref:methyltransferase domain-containing protein n=1 Tax=Pseudonocardia sp. TaxID=60912 RepID=UPI0026285CFB|nr:methyltransferase domain-containing protein [Pseudonocardia sp.]